jgi:hypothetical protein
LYTYSSLQKTKNEAEEFFNNQETSVSAIVQENLDIKNNPHYSSPHVIPYSQIVTVKDEYGSAEKVITLPSIRNVSSTAISDSINSLFTFEKVTDSEFSDLKESTGGVTDVDYVIHYDKNNILSISILIDFLGAYPSSDTKNYVINIVTGNTIKISDLIVREKLPEFLIKANAKLQSNIDETLKNAIQNDVQKMEDSCSEADVKEYLHEYLESPDYGYGKFTANSLDNLSITKEGIFLFYNFDFPHVVLACQPSNEVFFSFSELKSQLSPLGLLIGEIR